jgi:ABC-type microcin C transport system permease subunit YejB
MSSLIELILEQQAILISLSVIGLVILLAVAIVVGVQVRKVMAKMAVIRAQRKAEAERRKVEAAARKEAARARKRRAEETPDTEEVLSPTIVAGLATFAEVPPETAPEEETTPENSAASPTAPTSAPAAVATDPAATTTASTEEASSSDDAMKDLLSSVFFDEGAQERFDNLLRGREPIDIGNLTQLSQKVATALKNAIPAASGS